MRGVIGQLNTKLGLMHMHLQVVETKGKFGEGLLLLQGHRKKCPLLGLNTAEPLEFSRCYMQYKCCWGTKTQLRRKW